MSSLQVIAPAKVNLHLEVLGLRSDGFHELALMMQSIDLADELLLDSTKDGVIRLSCNCTNLDTGPNNLVVQAAELLRCRYGSHRLGAYIHLNKHIPIGAGLAGGSSDAAATLVGLNALWKLGLHRQQLEYLAIQLGSDVPFCIAGGAQLCFGRGHHLEPLPVLHCPTALLLVKNPEVSVSTPWAYQRYRELFGSRYLGDGHAFEMCRQQLRDRFEPRYAGIDIPPLPLRNDLQEVVAPVTPSVRVALELLQAIPDASGVAMSGSGPSCFALFADLKQASTMLELNRSRLETAGFQVWCCSFLPQGAKLSR